MAKASGAATKNRHEKSMALFTMFLPSFFTALEGNAAIPWVRDVPWAAASLRACGGTYATTAVAIPSRSVKNPFAERRATMGGVEVPECGRGMGMDT
jgi:hypothetical protein